MGASVTALVVVLASGAACVRDPSDDQPVAGCSLPPAVAIPADIPPDFPWPEGVGVTDAESTKKFVAITGFGEQTVEELFAALGSELSDKGFDIINSDYEGLEAELYFAKGDSLAGIASLREGPCDGYVKVNVVYDPLETAAGRQAVRKTRRLSGEGSR